ncbi:hypothetical protein BKA62DRAFT_828692 [Auriculariales sp. MPI-PUGE-AT-0066]|nr:hypothetical protein BKA62DRAFT_828692 [Auriculariales sp. MPI-PUGE-AT-0066]
MYSKFADETLSMIFTAALYIDEDDFLNWKTAGGPFDKRDYSTSDILLVCKQWLRVSTPLLFHSVVIRTVAQAQALAKALKLNPEFGVMVRNLRIEGACGASVRSFLGYMTALDTLCISVNIWPGQAARALPLFEALEDVNPRRLALCDAFGEGRYYKGTISLHPVCVAIRDHWTNLSSAVLPNAAFNNAELVHNIRSLKHLATHWPISAWNYLGGQGTLLRRTVEDIFVSIPKLQSLELIHDGLAQDVLVKEAEPAQIDDSNPVLSRITLASEASESVNIALMLKEAVASALAQSLAGKSLTSQPALITALPALRHAIWELILRHVVASDQCPSGVASWAKTISRQVAKVCKLFETIITRLTFEYLSFACQPPAAQHEMRWVSSKLVSSPRLGSRAIGLVVPSYGEHLVNRHQILITFCQLESLTIDAISVDMMLLFADVAGLSLTRMSIHGLLPTKRQAHASVSPDQDGDTNQDASSSHSEMGPASGVTLTFRALRSLAFSPSYRFSPAAPGSAWEPESVQWILPELQALEINTHAFCEWLIPEGFEHSEIPKLRKLNLKMTGSKPENTKMHKPYHNLIRAVGDTLEEAGLPYWLAREAFKSCTKLRELKVYDIVDSTYADWSRAFRCQCIPERLQILSLPALNNTHYYNRSCFKKWSTLQEVFDKKSFPALEEICLTDYRWPTESRVVHSVTVEWSEPLLQRGIRLLDADRRPWRPRLLTKAAITVAQRKRRRRSSYM